MNQEESNSIESMDLMTRLNSLYDDFSKGQKAIARYIIDHYDKAAFMTANRLGEVVGISESTVVRFANRLGYKGYPELSQALQDLIRNRLTSVQRLEVTADLLSEHNILKSVMNDDIERISATISSIDENMFAKAIESTISAKRIYIIGVRSTAALAGFLNFYFNLLFDNVRLINTNSVSDMFEQLLRVEEGDLVIGFSFPRYSRRTVKALQFAHDRGAKVIAITDSALSPIAQYADFPLYAKTDNASFVDSLVAPLSLVNAYVVAIGVEKKQTITNTFEMLESIWEEYRVYQ
ncbi:MAG: MurR/RpiR family transcriptional regulator [Clostridiales bacterium]|nr:MurR/RpiR family transcriptional regulator [Clostridiales bacterium]